MDQVDKILEHDWDAANQRGQEALAAGPLAASAHYDQPTGKIVIELNNGVGLHIPPTLIQGMESATPADMAEIVIEGHGIGLHFPRLDADLYVPIEEMIELMQEDLPAPVAPAMRMWGISARLTMTGRPAMSRPRATSRGWTARRASMLERTSPSVTSWRCWFGTSTPIAERPGMGARMRTSGEAIA